jgi:hypothetical protein
MDRVAAFCSLLRKIKSNLSNYAAGYKERFEERYSADLVRECGK